MSYINQREINWELGTICFQKEVHQPEPKLMQVLAVLYQSRGKIVSQQELLEKAWPDTIVSPNTIQRTIGQLRKHLGDTSEKQKVIETYPKRGYRLLDASTPSSTGASLLNKIKPILALGSILIGLILIAVTWLSSVATYQISPWIISDTFDGAGTHQHSVSLSEDQNFAAYIEQQSSGQRLMLKNLDNQTSQVLTEVQQAGVGSAISPNGRHIVFSSIEKQENYKCSRLMLFELSKMQTKALTQCNDGFYTTPQWISVNELVYVLQTKSQRSSIGLLELNTQNSHTLWQSEHPISGLALSPDKQGLAWLSAEGQVFTGKIDVQSLSNITHTLTQATIAADAQPSWLNNLTLVVPAKSELMRFQRNKVLPSQPFNAPGQFIKLTPMNGNEKKWLAQSRLSDWDVHLRASADSHAPVAKSGFQEKFARFVPSSKGISFLSDRSGTQQVWQQTTRQLAQLTQSDTEITSYVWSDDGQHLYFINQQGLWVKSIQQKEMLLTLPFSPLRLYQWSAAGLLMATEDITSGERQLVTLDTNTLQWRVELNRDTLWAQKVSPSIVITNDKRGRLQKFVNGQQSEIKALPEFIIQPYYFTLNSSVYLQDKDFNIWRYQPEKQRAEVVDHYDENSVFMTDYRPRDKALLSENFIRTQQQLVWLSQL